MSKFFRTTKRFNTLSVFNWNILVWLIFFQNFYSSIKINILRLFRTFFDRYKLMINLRESFDVLDFDYNFNVFWHVRFHNVRNLYSGACSCTELSTIGVFVDFDVILSNFFVIYAWKWRQIIPNAKRHKTER